MSLRENIARKIRNDKASGINELDLAIKYSLPLDRVQAIIEYRSDIDYTEGESITLSRKLGLGILPYGPNSGRFCYRFIPNGDSLHQTSYKQIIEQLTPLRSNLYVYNGLSNLALWESISCYVLTFNDMVHFQFDVGPKEVHQIPRYLAGHVSVFIKAAKIRDLLHLDTDNIAQLRIRYYTNLGVVINDLKEVAALALFCSTNNIQTGKVWVYPSHKLEYSPKLYQQLVTYGFNLSCTLPY